MLRQRSSTGIVISNHSDNNGKSNGNQLDNPRSAKASALSCQSDQDLRVPCYCEENVWRLAYRRVYGRSAINNIDKENEQYHVVFISNDDKCCPMLHQKASKYEDDICFWDYHVILLQSVSVSGKNKKSTHVLDMDSRLPYSCPLDEYLNESFKLDFGLLDNETSQKYSPKFRVVRAELYLQNFYSDRMHMFVNGEWSSPPPKYDCIITDEGLMNKTGSMSNLKDYINMVSTKGKDSSPMMGDVMNLDELRAKFGG